MTPFNIDNEVLLDLPRAKIDYIKKAATRGYNLRPAEYADFDDLIADHSDWLPTRKDVASCIERLKQRFIGRIHSRRVTGPNGTTIFGASLASLEPGEPEQADPAFREAMRYCGLRGYFAEL